MGSTVFYNAAAELATVSNVFALAGTPTDPTAVTLTVTDPDGVTTTYTWPTPATITRISAGSFTKDVSCASTNPGIWTAVWAGTDTASDVEPVTWTTHDTALHRLYCTPRELKDRVGINDDLDNAEILAACEAVSRWIDGHCERRFWRGTDTRYYEPCDLYLLPVHDLVSVTTLKTDSAADGTYETTWTASDYQLRPLNAASGPETRPYTEIKAIGSNTFPVTYSRRNTRADSVEIAGVFGWARVPDPVKHAAAIMSADFLKLGGMAFGAGGYAEYGPMRARPNPIATALLAPYRRYAVLVG